MSAQTTIWFRNKEQKTLHEVVEGSEQHRQMSTATTDVDIEDGQIPEPVYERVQLAEVRKIDPSKVPGYTSPEIQEKRRERIARSNGLTIVQTPAAAGASDEEIQARIDAAVQAAVEKTLAALAEAKEPQDPAADPAAASNDQGQQKPAATTPKGK